MIFFSFVLLLSLLMAALIVLVNRRLDFSDREWDMAKWFTIMGFASGGGTVIAFPGVIENYLVINIIIYLVFMTGGIAIMYWDIRRHGTIPILFDKLLTVFDKDDLEFARRLVLVVETEQYFIEKKELDEEFTKKQAIMKVYGITDTVNPKKSDYYKKRNYIRDEGDTPVKAMAVKIYMDKKHLPLEQVCKYFNLSPDYFKQWLDQHN